MGTQSVVSFFDLETELCAMLRSFNIPITATATLTHSSTHAPPPPPPLHHTPSDPNELNIDLCDDNNDNNNDNDNDDQPLTSCVISNRFEMFGLGPLARHPHIQHMFPDLHTEFAQVTTADVISRLEEFISSSQPSSASIFNSKHTGNSGNGSGSSSFSLSLFKDYLCEYYETHDLSTLGIVIRGSMKAELLMIRHIQARREELLLDMQKKFLNNINGQGHSAPSHIDNNAKRKPANAQSNNNMTCVANLKIDIYPSTREGTLSLLDCFQKKLDCPYAPSYGKTHNLLESLWKEDKKKYRRVDIVQSGGDQAMVNQKSKKRRRKSNSTADNDAILKDNIELTTFENNILCAAAELVMLHVGGSKHKSKTLFIKQPESIVISKSRDIKKNRSGDGGNDVADESDLTEKVINGNEGNSSEVDSSSRGSKSSADQGDDDDSSSSSGDDDDEEEEEDDSSTSSDDKDSSSSSDDKDSSSSSDDDDAEDTSIEAAGKSQSSVNVVAAKRVKSISNEIPFEGRITMGSLRCEPSHVESIDVAEFLPWCQTNSLTQNTSKIEHLRSIGRWGESLVYQYLLFQFPDRVVTWLNEKEETNASYDLKLERRGNSVSTDHGARTIFVEVKATQYSDKNVFQISKWEWDFMSSLPRVQYDIYRVYNAGNGKTVRLAVYHDVFKLIEERKIQLCLAV